MKRCMMLVCMAALLPLSAQADDIVRMITVQGQAHREVVPDIATVQVTAESKNREAAAAKKAMDKQIESLFGVAAKHGIDKKDLKTQYGSLQPEYNYNDGKQVFIGYHASTTVEVKIRALDKTGEVVQALVAGGFSNMSGPYYSVDNIRNVQEELVLEALDNAKAKAGKMAARLGQKIGKPVEISEGAAEHSRPQPVMVRAMKAEALAADMAGGSTPPAGQQRIDATATVSFELKD